MAPMTTGVWETGQGEVEDEGGDWERMGLG